MIEINLLPEYLRTVPEKEKEKKRGEAVLKKNVFVFVGICAGGLMCLYLILVVVPDAVYGKRAVRYERTWHAISADFTDIDTVIQKEKKLMTKEAQLRGQETTGTMWSMILSGINEATPGNVQLSSIRNEISQEFIVEKVVVMEAGKKIEKEKRGIKFNKVLTISGSYASGKKNDDMLDNFVDSLKAVPIFKQLFDHIELLSYETTEGGKKNFAIKCWFKEEPKAGTKGKVP